MKRNDHPEVPLERSNRFNKYLFLTIACLLGWVGQVKGQCVFDKDLFHSGEQVNYDIYFKWGLIMPKAGQATFEMKDTQYKGDPVWRYRLHFRTTGIIEKAYRMRDTLDTYFTPDLRLFYSSKRTNEKNYYLVENITFTPVGNQTRTHTHRYNLQATRIDTTYTSVGCVLDMVGGAMLLRSIDWNKLSQGQEISFKVAIGRDIVNVSFRYNGQAIVERNEKLKYRTRHFYVDIYDEAFTQSKEAAEVWIGDDENHLPVKARAKLKIGAAEVYYNSSQNLKYPLTSRVEIP